LAGLLQLQAQALKLAFEAQQALDLGSLFWRGRA